MCQIEILNALRDSEKALTSKQLSKDIGILQSSITRALRQLVKFGYVNCLFNSSNRNGVYYEYTGKEY